MLDTVEILDIDISTVGNFIIENILGIVIFIPLIIITRQLAQKKKEKSARDWSSVEQNAYDRIREGSTENVSAEEFLNWLSELEQGRDV